MARGDTIFVISPGYMDAISSCITRYRDFELQAYSSSVRALDGLERTPSYSYLGFSYLNNGILDQDYNNLRMIVNKVNIMYQGIVDPEDPASRIPFVFVLSPKEGGRNGTAEYVKAMLRDIDLTNVQLLYCEFNIMTDTIIKTQMFGTILLRNRDFEIKSIVPNISKNNEDSMVIDLPFGSKFLELFSELSLIEMDPYIQQYTREDPVLANIRRYMYTKDPAMMTMVKRAISQMSVQQRIFYDCCLRNLQYMEIEGGSLDG